MSNDNTTWRIPFGNETFCYKWYEEYQKFSYCPTEEPKTTHPAVMTFMILIYGAVTVATVYGNVSVLYIVTTTKSLRNVNNILIANLAVSDIVIGVICIPFQFHAALVQRWDLPQFMCKVCPFVMQLSVNANVFTLVLIAHDRYKAIMRPLNQQTTKKTTLIMLILAWVLALILAFPNLIVYQFNIVYDAGHGLKPYCMTKELELEWPPVFKTLLKEYSLNSTNIEDPEGENSPMGMFKSNTEFYLFSSMICQYVLPFMYLIMAYTKISVKLWYSQIPGNHNEERDQNLTAKKKKSIKMMTAVVVIFGICWFPFFVFKMVKIFWTPFEKTNVIKPLFFVCHWIAMSNGCYNPFIYAIFSQPYKSKLKHYRQRIKQQRNEICGSSNSTQKSLREYNVSLSTTVIYTNSTNN